MPSRMRSRMAVDRTSGRIAAFAADQDLDGGGLANLSAAVAFVGATASVGIYDVPKVDVTTVARHSRAVTAGSMRGFGALQTMTALEVMIDEAAAKLGQDPVAFRKANLLKTGGKTMVGNVVAGALRSGEVLDRLASKPLWTGRAAEKLRRAAAAPGKAYGVGLACVSTVFGSGSDPAFALVEIDPAGRITVTSQAVEIGTGIATALAVRVADRLGVAADEVQARRARRLGRARAGHAGQSVHHHARAAGRGGEESALGSRRRAGHHRIDLGPYPHRGRGRGGERDPALRPLAGGAGDLVAGRSAARPPASSCASRMSASSTARLTAAGMEPLPLPRLAAKAHEMGLVVAAMVHGYNRWAWARASFDLPDGRYEGAIDALAVKYGSGAAPARKALMTTQGYQRFDRVAVTFPPTLFERDRRRLHVGERQRRRGRDRQGDRRGRRSSMPSPCSNAGARSCRNRSPVRPKAASPWAPATRCTNICRSTRTAPATAPGTSIAIGCRAPPTFRSGSSRSTCCRRSDRPTFRRGSPSSS